MKFYDIHDNHLKILKRKNKDGKDNYTTEITVELMQLCELLLQSLHGVLRPIQAQPDAEGRMVGTKGQKRRRKWASPNGRPPLWSCPHPERGDNDCANNNKDVRKCLARALNDQMNKAHQIVCATWGLCREVKDHPMF